MCVVPIEQVRTQTLVKSAIVQVDATPFKQYYSQHYGVEVGLKKKSGAAAAAEEEKKAAEEAKKASNHVERKLKQRNQNRQLDEVHAPACLMAWSESGLPAVIEGCEWIMLHGFQECKQTLESNLRPFSAA